MATAQFQTVQGFGAYEDLGLPDLDKMEIGDAITLLTRKLEQITQEYMESLTNSAGATGRRRGGTLLKVAAVSMIFAAIKHWPIVNRFFA